MKLTSWAVTEKQLSFGKFEVREKVVEQVLLSNLLAGSNDPFASQRNFTDQIIEFMV